MQTDFSLTAAWMQDGQLVAADRPLARLVALNGTDLPALLDEARAWQRRGHVLAGLISYPFGKVLHGMPPRDDAALEIQIFARDQIHPLAVGTNTPAQGWCSPFESEQNGDDYLRALQRIRHYLQAGDCYQINFARRFSARLQGEPQQAWLHLLAHHPAPHASFFQRANGDCIFGVSPERFVRVEGNTIVTEPIKGSRPRGRTDEEDQAIGQSLLDSPKDRAENLMIVDLLRNDLGRVCVPGSVHAEPLFELRRFSNVQHLVSTVRGQLRDEVDALDALLACFPGGSITGAPKRRAMEIIEELEPVSRGCYCGTQFVLDENGDLDSNILIRTFQTRDDRIFCHGGGGIVIDSDPVQEFNETRFKVEPLMNTLQGMASTRLRQES